MNVLIIEDEGALARQLQRMLLELSDEVTVLQMVASVRESIKFLQAHHHVDLIFADIYLNDGLSFEIFEKIGCPAPIIFCTAYDQYAIKAFELDSVDYLLKPVKKEELKKAVDKYRRLFEQHSTNQKLNQSIHKISEKLLNQKSYRQSFLLTFKDRLVPVGVEEISHIRAEYGMIKCVTFDHRFFPMDLSLDTLSDELDPTQYYRANRQYLISRKSIVDVEFYFNGRLFVNIRPKPTEPVIISKAKASDFKDWMNNVATYQI